MEFDQKSAPNVESILNTVIDAIITIDERGIIQSTNPAVERLFGYTTQELLRKNVSVLMPQPYSREHDGYLQNYLRTGDAKIIGIGREIVARHKNGTVFPIYLGISEFRSENRRFFTGVIRDITEMKRYQDDLKKQNEFTAAILDTVRSLVLVLDLQGRVVNFNRACEETTGYSFQEVASKPFSDFFLTMEDRRSMVKNFLGTDPKRFPNNFECIWLTKKGEKRLIAWSNSTLLSKEGAVEHVIGTGIDITERRNLERTVLEVTKKEQQRLGQELHDGIAQHLTATAVAAKVLEKKLAAASRPAAKDMKRIVEMINHAITQTRELAQGLYALEMQSDNFISSLKKLVQETEKTTGIRCAFRADKEVRISDNTSATHLYRIAREAVSNAVKHGRSKSILIRLSQKSANEAELSVENDGAAFLEAGPKSGGLGLHIMQSRAAVINASLELKPNPKGGVRVACIFRASA